MKTYSKTTCMFVLQSNDTCAEMAWASLLFKGRGDSTTSKGHALADAIFRTTGLNTWGSWSYHMHFPLDTPSEAITRLLLSSVIEKTQKSSDCVLSSSLLRNQCCLIILGKRILNNKNFSCNRKLCFPKGATWFFKHISPMWKLRNHRDYRFFQTRRVISSLPSTKWSSYTMLIPALSSSIL